MAKRSPLECSAAKALGACAPSGFSLGTSLGTPFTTIPPRLFHTLSHSVPSVPGSLCAVCSLAAKCQELAAHWQILCRSTLQQILQYTIHYHMNDTTYATLHRYLIEHTPTLHWNRCCVLHYSMKYTTPTQTLHYSMY